MTITSNQLSNPLDERKVETLLRVAPLANQRGVPLLLVGAFARDVHLWHIHNIEITRSTADIDLSIQLPSWDGFEDLRALLLKSGFEKPDPDHQEKFRDSVTDQEIDLIPFGAISQDGEKIIWPGGDHPFSIVGFQDALEHALLLDAKESCRDE
jgi:predicted nucleotidyltransferase